MPIDPISSASSGGANPFEEAIERMDRQRQAEPVNPFIEATEALKVQDLGKLDAAARWSRKFDPDVAARVNGMMPQVPVDTAVRQRELVEQKDRQAKFGEVFKKNPDTRRLFAENPKDLTYANPDELDNLSGIRWMLEAGPAAAQAGMNQVRAAMASNRIAAGQGTIEDEAFLKNWNPNRTFGAHGFLDGALTGVSEQIAPLTGSALHAALGWLKGAVYGGTAGAAAGSVLPGVGTISGGAAGAAGGGRVGAVYGSLDFQRQLQTGLSRLRFQQIRDENGNPLEPELIEFAANVSGLGGAALEQIALSQFARVIPGSDRLAQFLNPKGMEQVLRTPGMRQALGNFVKNTGMVVGTEITTEVLQEGLTILSQEVAKQSSERDFTTMTAEEVGQELGSAAYQALQVMTLMGPFASGTRFGADLYRMRGSKARNEQLKEVAAFIDGNGLVERKPDLAAKVIDAQVPGQSVYIDAEEFVELYQSQNLDPFGPPLPNWRDRLEGALATGGDVVLTYGEFLAYFGADPKANPIMELAKTDPRDYSNAEMKEFSEGIDDLLGNELAHAQKGAAPEVTVKDTRVHDEIKRQVQGAGFTAEAAEHYATLWQAYFDTQAAKLGTTAAELFAQSPIDIQREGMEALGGLLGISNEGTARPEDLPDTLFQPAWHGTPHEFEQFDIGKIGTGEGNQAFGWGLYFAGDRGVAEGYRDRLSRQVSKHYLDGMRADPETQEVIDVFAFQNATKAEIEQQVAQAIEVAKAEIADPFDGVQLGQEHVDWVHKLERSLAKLQAAQDLTDSTRGEYSYVTPEGAKTVPRGRHSLQTIWNIIDEVVPGLTKLERSSLGTLIYNNTQEPLTKAELDAALDGFQALYGDEGAQKLMTAFTSLDVKEKPPGRLFEVDLPDDEHLMVWDAPMDEQPEAVRQAFADTGLAETVIPFDPDSSFNEFWTAQNMYEQLSQALGGDQAASQYLLSKGILGHKYLKGGSARRRGTTTFRAEWRDFKDPESWHVRQFSSREAAREFLEEDRGFDLSVPDNDFARIVEIKAPIEDFNFVMYDDKAVNVKQFFQDKRGAIQFRKDGSSLIRLFDQSDMSTLLHEAAHFFLENTKKLAEGNPELAAEYEAIKAKFGIGPEGPTREQHEEFAKAAERYFMEGKAPTPELRSAFEAFRNWLLAVYDRLRNIGGRVDPEVRQIFDRMLTTQARLDAISQDTSYAPLFKTAQDMGVSPEDYLEYQKLVQDLKDDASETTISRIVGDTAKLVKGWRGQILKQLTAEAEAKLVKTPPYSHAAKMREGKITINPEDFKEAGYSAAAAKKFPRGAFKTNGMHPEIVSGLLGYPSADEMVNDFINAPPLKEAAKAEAKAELERRFGQDFNQTEQFDAMVKAAMAREGRVLLLAKEYKALQAKAGRTVSEKGPKALAEEIARKATLGKQVRELSARNIEANARRAAAMSEAAAVKGDWVKAADWKRKQILAQAIHNQTQEALDTVEKIQQKAIRYTRTKGSKNMDPATMEKIKELVTQYEFAKVPLKKLDKRESLREYLEKAEADGLVTSVPDYLIRQAGRKNFRELTVEELLGLGDTLDNLEHLGRLKQKLRVGKELREWNAVKSEVLQSLAQFPSKTRTRKTHSAKEGELKKIAIDFLASLHKPEQIIEWLDAGDISGPMMQYVFQPLVEANNAKQDMLADYNGRITEIFEKIPNGYLAKVFDIPSIRSRENPSGRMTRQEIYSVALNMGNASNRQKMLEGELWTEQQLEEITSHLTKEDWDRIQKIWNVLDSLWDKIAALEKKLTGVTPPKIAPQEVVTPYGTYDGGYYPVVYDFDTQRGLNLLEDTTPIDRRLADTPFSNRFIRPGTNHKHTVKRLKVAKPMRLELGVLPGHIHNVVHDLTHREAVRTAYKLLWDPEIKRAIEQAQSPETSEQLQHWLRTIATDHALEPVTGRDALLERARVGATVVGMGYRATTAIAQIFGIFPAMTKVGLRHIAAGVTQMARHPVRSLEFVNAKSGEMRHRFNQQDRDIRHAMNQLEKKKTPLDTIIYYAFHHIAAFDKAVSTAIWLGAYREGVGRGLSDDLAVQHADRTVRLSQGTGFTKDAAKIVTQGGARSIFAMFYSFASAQHNMQTDLTRRTIRDIKSKDWKALATDMLHWSYLIVFPAILSALATGNGPDEDESWAAWMARKSLAYPFMGTPFVRDIVGAIESGFDYKLSPAGKLMDSMASVGKALYKEDPNFGAAIKPTATALAILAKLPLGQPISTIEALWKGLENGDLELQDLFLGRRDK